MSVDSIVNLKGKIIRYTADTLWEYRATEVMEDDGASPELSVRHFDMTRDKVPRHLVLGYMDKGVFVELKKVE